MGRIHFCQSIANIKISVEPIFKYLHPRIRLSAMETARKSESIKIELRNKAGLWFAISVSSFLFLCSLPPRQWILLLQWDMTSHDTSYFYSTTSMDEVKKEAKNHCDVSFLRGAGSDLQK